MEQRPLNKDPFWLNEGQFRQNTDLALQWLEQSIAATGYHGSAAYFQKRPWGKGKWSAAYPETSGYLIETLLDYSAKKESPQLRKQASQLADWLLTMQGGDGSFPGGLTGNKASPSVFNTGMILFGLVSAANSLDDARGLYRKAALRAGEWLLNSMEPDGRWVRNTYVKGYSPSYHTRVLWALLKMNKLANDSIPDAKIAQAFDYYRNRIGADQFIQDCGFFPGKPALTHTLAYCLRGWIESAFLLKDEKLYRAGKTIALQLADILITKGKVAGTFDTGWRPDYSFSCPAGNAQLSVVFLRFFEKEGDPLFFQAATIAFEAVVKTQNKSKSHGLCGAIPGSAPVWGPYFRFRYPNWAAKFFLDAYLYFIKLINHRKSVRG